MGICSSCLGLNNNRDLSEEDENSRLLFDDPHTSHYGSFSDQNTGIVQADPQELQRENEALQKVVAQTSNHLVDIFAMVPQNGPPTTTFPVHDTRLLRYQDVLAKMSSKGLVHLSPRTNQASTESALNSDGWISEEDDAEDGNTTVKSESLGPLLGGFADAETVE